VLGLARRLTGLVVAVALVAGLPVAAACASCVCDHMHRHAGAPATAADAPAMSDECPMHRHDGRSSHTAADATRAADAMRCACAGQAQALFGRAIIAVVLPAVIDLDAPVFARPSPPSLAEALVALAATPPAPPPRA
jgi:hypothetical protein